MQCNVCLFSRSQVPAYLCTSPLPLEAAEETAEPPEGCSIAGSGIRRKKRRRRRMRPDTHLREDACSSSEERERDKEWEKESDHAAQDSAIEEQLATALQLGLVSLTDSTEQKDAQKHHRTVSDCQYEWPPHTDMWFNIHIWTGRYGNNIAILFHS